MEKTKREVMEFGDGGREERVLPGFRFHPTDEELVGFYLRRKVERKPISIEIIKHVDIYKYDPWDLPRVNSHGNKEWYFFCMRGGSNRIDRPIYTGGSGGGDCIGLKKSLVYYRGCAGKGTKTDWMMHEFRLPSPGCGGDDGRGGSQKRYPQAQRWESPVPAADSGSKTSSGDSDGFWDSVGHYTHPPAPAVLESDFNSAAVQYEEKVQPYQWTSPVQSSPLLLHSNPVHGNDFFLKDGLWDEIDRIAEFSVDPSSLIFECTY
ncbi:unnamed protein product [Spirodela intermedia]|uniref:NAC domain-containing protein n=1 Tax=Spirodela intermedia TaxID=51605 RepID=A0A7I8IKZ0_SPIIN|nr:unnamed protein product [Spirodela intermedia]CAA6658053.1 unnamed protein product [Spirodela intermedia]